MSAVAVVVTYGHDPLLSGLVAQLVAATDVTRVVVVDNGAPDGVGLGPLPMFDDPRIEAVVPTANGGFGSGVALAAGCAAARDADVLLVANADLELTAADVDQLVGAARRHGLAAPALSVDRSGCAEYGVAANHLLAPTARTTPDDPRPTVFVPGCLLAITRELWEAVGGFDERYFLFVEDLELSWRARMLGYPPHVEDGVHVRHVGGGTIAGGYTVPGQRYRTTAARVSLRERNTLTAMLSLLPLALLPAYLLLWVVRTVAAALVLGLIGHRPLAGALVGGLAWNLREFPRTWRRRRSLPVSWRSRMAAFRACSPHSTHIRALRTIDLVEPFVEDPHDDLRG